MNGRVTRVQRAVDPVQDVEQHIERRRGVLGQRQLQEAIERTRRTVANVLRIGDGDAVLFEGVRDIRFTGSGVSIDGSGEQVTLTITAGSGSGISIVQEGDVTVDGSATTLDFDASDFNVTSSPSGEANIALAYGTSAGTPAEGNHTHAQLHDAVTVSDTGSIDLTLTGQQISAAAIFGTTAGTVAQGNHTHTTALDDLSDVVITALAEGEALTHNGTNVVDAMHVNFTVGPFYINDLPGTATTQATLNYYNTATASNRSTNDPKMARSGRVIGAIITSDAARTAGTATVQVRVAGSATAFSSGACALDASNTTSDSEFVGYTNGVAFSAGNTLGAAVVTSGWTPITANVNVMLIVQMAAYTG